MGASVFVLLVVALLVGSVSQLYRARVEREAVSDGPGVDGGTRSSGMLLWVGAGVGVGVWVLLASLAPPIPGGTVAFGVSIIAMGGWLWLQSRRPVLEVPMSGVPRQVGWDLLLFTLVLAAAISSTLRNDALPAVEVSAALTWGPWIGLAVFLAFWPFRSRGRFNRRLRRSGGAATVLVALWSSWALSWSPVGAGDEAAIGAGFAFLIGTILLIATVVTAQVLGPRPDRIVALASLAVLPLSAPLADLGLTVRFATVENEYQAVVDGVLSGDRSPEGDRWEVRGQPAFIYRGEDGEVEAISFLWDWPISPADSSVGLFHDSAGTLPEGTENMWIRSCSHLSDDWFICRYG